MITKERLHELFEYIEGKLYWKVDNGNGVNKGDEVGTIIRKQNQAQQYYVTNIKGKRFYVHKIIYAMFNEIAVGRIRFLDGNSLNYAIENLKQCSTSEILFTSNKRKDNASGYKGVSWCKLRNKWMSYISKDSKRIWLGYFDNKETAYDAYIKKSIEIYGKM
jgi:hypothetical protein